MIIFLYLCYKNIFQTTLPRVSDVWLSHFNSQLANCYEPVVEAVNIPVEEDSQLLHQVREDLVQDQEEDERDVALPLFRMLSLSLPRLVTRLFVTWGCQF